MGLAKSGSVNKMDCSSEILSQAGEYEYMIDPYRQSTRKPQKRADTAPAQPPFKPAPAANVGRTFGKYEVSNLIAHSGLEIRIVYILLQGVDASAFFALEATTVSTASFSDSKTDEERFRNSPAAMRNYVA